MIEPIYDRDGITIYNANCLDVLPQLEQVDHVITDPPYEAEAHGLQRRQKGAGWRNATVGAAILEKPLEFGPIDADLRAAVAIEWGRLCLRWCLVFAQAEGASSWDFVLQEAGMTRRRWCVWVKPDGQPQYSGDRPGMGYETIVAFHAKGASRWNGGGKVGVFTHTRAQGGPHPTTKPLSLMTELSALFTDPGDVILDPFMGSGTTLVAAKQLGRKAIGIEMEEKWCHVAIKRLEATTPPLFVESRRDDAKQEALL